MLYKSEAASWFRIYEIYQFGSCHMYGIIGSALVLGIIGVQIIKNGKFEPLSGGQMQLHPKNKGITRYLVGGVIFGSGWALAGACPGRMYTLEGVGYYSILLVVGALLGTFVYGLLRNKLPH